MFNKVIVPLDGSELAERALPSALQLGARHEAEVVLLRVSVPEKVLVPDTHVAGGYGLLWPDQSLEQSRAEAEEYLRALSRARVSPGQPVRLEVVEGSVAEEILEAAAREHADLIVMSSHGYSGVTRWVLGSIAEKVLPAAPCPVLVLRGERPLRRFLVPLDGSELSERALTPALAAAAVLGAEVTLLRVLTPVPAAEKEQLDTRERGLGERLEGEIRQAAEESLRAALARRPTPGVTVRLAVEYGPAAETILQYAETHHMDVIAMSTHGRAGLSRWLYGSVTEKVLHGGRHSMLVVRPQAPRLN